MKTFLLNIPERLKFKSQTLDAQAVLCNKAWTVFNNEGVKQLFIFQPDGSLLITINGVVYNSTWKYLPVNNSVVITSEGKSTMFHPAFMDSIVFALEQDGGAECLFMIDEVNQKAFSPKTLAELNYYLNRKEQLLIEEEIKQKEHEAERQRELERQKQDKLRRIEDERRKEREASQRKEEERVRKQASDLRDSLDTKGGNIVIIILIIVFPLAIVFGMDLIDYYFPTFWGSMLCILGLLFVDMLLIIWIQEVSESIQEKRIEAWKEDHPNDPRNQYL